MPKIIIDPGHGYNDPGATGNGLQEKDITLKIGTKLADYLSTVAEVKMTRTDDNVFSVDKATDLNARAEFANHWEADLFVSIHINAFDGKASGFESYRYTNAGAQTAAYQNVIHKAVSAEFAKVGLVDRGQQSANFAVLRETSMPALLNEYGFIDCAKDASLLKDDSFLDRLALATANGICSALGLPKIEPKKDIPIVDGFCKVQSNGITFDGVIIAGHSYAPVRDVAEGLGKTVDWDGNTDTVIIK